MVVVLALPFEPVPSPLACGVVGRPVAVGEGTGAVLDAGHAGPTSSNPVWTPFVRIPPSSGNGVARLQTGSADAGGMSSANEPASTSKATPNPARFMAFSVTGSPQIIHAPHGPNSGSPQ